LEIERIEQGDPLVVVFRLKGRLIATKECLDFLEDVRKDVRRGHSRIVFNLEQIQQVSSTGIGIIAASYVSITNAGARMRVAGASETARKLLELVCLWPLLEHHDTEEEALAALRT
jgi:anti-anti-sigma factor